MKKKYPIKKSGPVSIVTSGTRRKIKERFLRLLNDTPQVQRGTLLPMVHRLLGKKTRMMKMAEAHKTPFYLIDQEELEKSAHSFLHAFRAYVPRCEAFYAVKLNSHPSIIDEVVRQGFGLDVSSARELEIALRHKAKKIVFSGPGKTESDLALALRHHNKVIVNIDSFGELERLGALAKQKKTCIRAGVRIYTKQHGEWTKFGIPLADLKLFWEKARSYPAIQLEGIQSHTSWNNDVEPYENILRDIATYVHGQFSPSMIRSIRFIDFGGGFRPYESEGYYPWTLPVGRAIKAIDEYDRQETKFKDRYYITKAVPIENYAKGIGGAIKKYLDPLLPQCAYYTEPGRIICNNAMHVIMRVVDVKSSSCVILDGGINIVGWERFEYDYFPLINLTNPSYKEINYNMFGPLCMPQDIWGHYCYAKRIRENDVILVPYQGAMTYSLAQNFIHPIPPVYILKN